MASNSKLKAYVRYDGSGRVIPGSLILNRFKPKVGNWKEINANECCNDTLPSNCIEFVANTTLGGLSFAMTVESSEDITYIATWGDGTTSNGTIIGGEERTDIEHLYTAEDTAHTVQLCFSDPSKVTYLSFWGTD